MALKISIETKVAENDDNNDDKKENKDLNDWDSKEIIAWIKRVDDGKLNDIKYEYLRKHIKMANIQGSELCHINETTLKLLGIKDVFDRNLILKYIFNLISKNEK